MAERITVDELNVKVNANSSNFQKELNKATSHLGQFETEILKKQQKISNFTNNIKKAVFGLSLGKILKDSLMNGMNAIENDSLFATTMGNFAKETSKWALEVSNALELNVNELKRTIGVIYNMSTSMGVGEKNALKLSKGISLLANDMASFYNIDPTEAFNKLRAGLTGETEPLKALGILVDENTVKQVAYANGIARVGSELTAEQKVLARYKAILQQTSNAQQDLARTIDSPSNQVRLFANNIRKNARSIYVDWEPAGNRTVKIQIKTEVIDPLNTKDLKVGAGVFSVMGNIRRANLQVVNTPHVITDAEKYELTLIDKKEVEDTNNIPHSVKEEIRQGLWNANPTLQDKVKNSVGGIQVADDGTTTVVYNDTEYVFIDTAGLRRKSKVKEDLERYSIIRTVSAVERADVVILVIDATEGITEQDAKIAGIAHDRGKGIIVAVNKWDAIEKNDKTIYEFTNNIKNTLSFMQYAEYVFISALSGQRLPKMF